MKKFIHDLYERLRKSGKVLRLGPLYGTKSVAELPDRRKAKTLYLIGVPKPWSAALLCPCGCGELIQLSLLPDDSPSWRIYWESRKRPSVEPSIWRTTGCRSHFFLRQGRILWCLERGRTHKRESSSPQ